MHDYERAAESTRDFYTVTEVAAELGTGFRKVYKLAGAKNIMRNGDGFKVIPGAVAARLIADKADREAANAEREAAERARREPNTHIAATIAKRDAQLANPYDASGLSNVLGRDATMAEKAAYAIRAAEGEAEYAEAVSDSEERMADFLSGEAVFRRIGPKRRRCGE